MSTLKQFSFGAGELTPSLYARVDTVKYATGVRTLRNNWIMRHGGTQNRPGSVFICEVSDSDEEVRLIPFLSSDGTAYVLVFNDGLIRFVYQAAQVLSGGSPYEVAMPYSGPQLAALRFAQREATLSIVHSGHAPAELVRASHTSWSLANMTFGPSISAPSSLANNGSFGAANTTVYAVSAVTPSFEESGLSNTVSPSGAGPTYTAPGAGGLLLTWSAVTGAGAYYVYANNGSGYASVGIAFTNSCTFLPYVQINYGKSPITTNNYFTSSSNYPSAVAYYQQRQIFAASDNGPATVWATRTGGNYKNLNTSYPFLDSDAITFTLAGRQSSRIKHVLDLGKLLLFTETGEWAVLGDDSGNLTYRAINAKQYGYNGASDLAPLVVGSNALYVQARGSIVRDLSYVQQVDGYQGNDLTTFSAHLVDDYELIDWAYQQTPHSIVWIVRDDGVLLGMTYVREHNLIGWHRHDTDGFVENVCTIPEGSEDAVYIVVRRTISGVSKRYVERLNTRVIDDIRDCIFMDCAVTFDGRNTDSRTMTLSGGTDWDYEETLTLTCSSAIFSSAYVGNEIQLTGADGESIRFTVDGYTDTTHLTGRANRTVPTSLRSTATTTWARAITQLTGLDHIEGKDVSVLGDGYVVASPNNPAYEVLTVDGGAITLPRPYAVVQVGLPYISDLETLDVDTAEGETMADKKMIVSKVTLHVEDTRGIWVGPGDLEESTDALEGMHEPKLRRNESYDEPVSLTTGKIEIQIQGKYSSNGRVQVRQVDPLPCSILAISPAGNFPIRR